MPISFLEKKTQMFQKKNLLSQIMRCKWQIQNYQSTLYLIHTSFQAAKAASYKKLVTCRILGEHLHTQVKMCGKSITRFTLHES